MSPIPPALPRPAPPSRRTPRRVASVQLMAGSREIIIEHGDDEYRLRLTGSGKLILTK
jgi:hemin uptake protein HemP